MLKLTILLIIAAIVGIRVVNRPRKGKGAKWQAIRFITKKKK